MVFVAAVLLLAPGVPSSAEDWIAHGVLLRRAGKNEEALEAFREAEALEPTARATAQIALAEQALGRWIDAERDLLRALDAPDAWVAEHQSALDGALAKIRSRLAWLDVRTNVDGVALHVNGTFTSTLPAARPARVVAGLAVLELRHDGYEVMRRRIDIAPNTTAREQIPMVAMLEVKPPPASPPPPPPPVATKVEVTPDEGVAPSAKWIAAGAAGALLAAGMTAAFVYEDTADRYNDDACAPMQLGQTRDDRCGDLRSRAEVARGIAWTGVVGAGVAAATAIVLWNLEADQRPLACVVGGEAVACALKF